MLIDQIHTYFKLKSDKSDSLQYANWLPEEIDYWYNTAISIFTTTRVTGNNPKGESVEQTNKRVNDLRTLVVEQEMNAYKDDNQTYKVNAYIAELPDDYLFTLSEGCVIAYNDPYVNRTVITTSSTALTGYFMVLSGTATTATNDVYVQGDVFYNNGQANVDIVGSVVGVTLLNTDVLNAKSDSFNRDVANPFSEHRLHYNTAKPLRLYNTTYVELITDGNYAIYSYILRYLRKPAKVSYFTELITATNLVEGVTYKVLGTITIDVIDYTDEVFTMVTDNIYTGTGAVYIRRECDLPEHTHEEILSLAVKLAFANVNNIEQYQTSAAELRQME